MVTKEFKLIIYQSKTWVLKVQLAVLKYMLKMSDRLISLQQMVEFRSVTLWGFAFGFKLVKDQRAISQSHNSKVLTVSVTHLGPALNPDPDQMPL